MRAARGAALALTVLAAFLWSQFTTDPAGRIVAGALVALAALAAACAALEWAGTRITTLVRRHRRPTA